MIASCKLLVNHIYTHLLTYSCQVPMCYWLKQNWSSPVDTCFSLTSELLQQGKETEAVSQLKPSEMNWSWGHKLLFPEIWQFPINTKSFVFWLLFMPLVFPLKGTIWENVFQEKGSDGFRNMEWNQIILFRGSWLIFIFLCVPVTTVAKGLSSYRSVIIRKPMHVYWSQSQHNGES